MNKKTVVLKNIDMELLSQQKNDLIDIIGFLEISLKDHPESHTENWISSLDGLLNMIDDMHGW
jgi:hypothetical protein